MWAWTQARYLTKQPKHLCFGCRSKGDPAGARTQDPNIKSVVLYLLSYEISGQNGISPYFGGAKVEKKFIITKTLVKIIIQGCVISCQSSICERVFNSNFYSIKPLLGRRISQEPTF